MRSDDRGQDDSTDEHDTPVMSPNLRGRRLDVTPPDTPNSRGRGRLPSRHELDEGAAEERHSRIPQEPQVPAPARPPSDPPVVKASKGWGAAVGMVMGAVGLVGAGVTAGSTLSRAHDSSQMDRLDERMRAMELAAEATKKDIEWIKNDIHEALQSQARMPR